jgi:hypothetical protein
MSRPRSRHCGKCGTLKITLKSGASRCLACHNRHGRDYYQRSPLRRWKQRESYVSRKYGVSMESLQVILRRQDGRCAICSKPWQVCATAKKVNHEVIFLQFLYVDHDHRTGEVRGLLCNACNTAIGLFEEDRARISSALSYLEGSQNATELSLQC